MTDLKKLLDAHDMGVEELISAAGTLHEPSYAHRCKQCGKLIAELGKASNDRKKAADT